VPQFGLKGWESAASRRSALTAGAHPSRDRLHLLSRPHLTTTSRVGEKGRFLTNKEKIPQPRASSLKRVLRPRRRRVGLLPSQIPGDDLQQSFVGVDASALLSRLARFGLIENTRTRGRENEWQLTPAGKELETAIRDDSRKVK
jgi:hypothetical protein